MDLIPMGMDLPVGGIQHLSARRLRSDRRSDPFAKFWRTKRGLMPKWVILHYTAMNSAAEAIERLCDPGIRYLRIT